MDLVLTICDLYFKIVKSKIKNFSPAKCLFLLGFLADPLLITLKNANDNLKKFVTQNAQHIETPFYYRHFKSYYFFFIIIAKHYFLDFYRQKHIFKCSYKFSFSKHTLLFLIFLLLRQDLYYCYKMKFIAIIIVFLAVNNSISAVRVGIIRNASLMLTVSSNITINRSTCNECVCVTLAITGNSSIVSLNCYINDIYRVVCQLFTMTDYWFSSFYKIETNFNSTFYFLQLPLSNPTETAITDIVTSSEGSILYFIVTPNKFKC